MKLGYVVCIVGLACAVFAAVSVDELAANHIKAMRDDGSVTNVIEKLVSDGTFCEVRGHQWVLGCGQIGCLVYHSGPTRHCSVCSSVQAQQLGPWK